MKFQAIFSLTFVTKCTLLAHIEIFILSILKEKFQTPFPFTKICFIYHSPTTQRLISTYFPLPFIYQLPETLHDPAHWTFRFKVYVWDFNLKHLFSEFSGRFVCGLDLDSNSRRDLEVWRRGVNSLSKWTFSKWFSRLDTRYNILTNCSSRKEIKFDVRKYQNNTPTIGESRVVFVFFSASFETLSFSNTLNGIFYSSYWVSLVKDVRF